jgi:peptidoglycan/LPS O-acetylase OafA/YrhL
MRARLKKTLRFFHRPAGRYWLIYVLVCSLLNLWVALAWGLTSWDPFEAVWTDGSLIVFCFGAMWLTLADLGRELRRAHPNSDSPLRDMQEWLLYSAVFASIIAVTCYVQFMSGGGGIANWGRAVISAAALLVGLVYAAQAITVTHVIADGDRRAT